MWYEKKDWSAIARLEEGLQQFKEELLPPFVPFRSQSGCGSKPLGAFG